MTDGSKPIQAEFKTRVLAALDALKGYPGAPSTLGQLADDAGVSPSNLASALSLRRTMTWSALRRLHRALKLDALGLDVAVWDQGVADVRRFADAIRGMRRGDPVELALAHSAPRPFFGVATAGAFMGIRPVRQADAPQRPGLAVYPGQALSISLNPPIDGFVKLLCREGAEFFSLDSHLNLGRRRFRAGETVTLERQIDVEPGYYGETVFIALAAADQFDGSWPRGFEPSDIVSRETCADLLRGLFASPEDRWRSSVFSVWTLPETLTPLS
jgi:hypothetical protein